MIKKCLNCNKSFKALQRDVERGQSRYCSKKCYYDSIKKVKEEKVKTELKNFKTELKNKVCQFCKAPAAFLIRDIWCCVKKINQCPQKRRENSERLKQQYANGRKGIGTGREGNKGNLGGTSWNKGLTKADPRIADIARKVSKKLTGNTNWNKRSKEEKEASSLRAAKAIQKRYDEGWQPKAGRCKKIKYQSSIAGEVSLDGSWELEVAKWLDQQGYRWLRNTKRFEYFDNTKLRHYTPDFFVETFNLYLEVKGYETDLDRLKWSQFKNKLQIIKRNEMELIRSNSFSLGGLAESG